MEMNYHLLFKILLVGDVEVRRSALPHPTASETPSSTPNIGVEFLKKTLEIGEYKRWSCDTICAFIMPLIMIYKQLGNSGNCFALLVVLFVFLSVRITNCPVMRKREYNKTTVVNQTGGKLVR